MAKQYQWRAITEYDSDTDLSYGVDPSTETNWQTANVNYGWSKVFKYWYRDSNRPNQYGQYTDDISSKVIVPVRQTWNVTVDEHNVIKITVSTSIEDVWRRDIRGNDQDLPARDIDLYVRSGNGWVLKWAGTDTQVATEHEIARGPLDFGEYEFSIPPGDPSVSLSSVRLRNETVGTSSYDDIKMGIQFRNILPPDYIPGKIYNGSNDWLSHNRDTNGHAKLYTGSAWGDDMKTVDGGTESGDPPEIWHSSSTKKNMRKIGLNS